MPIPAISASTVYPPPTCHPAATEEAPPIRSGASEADSAAHTQNAASYSFKNLAAVPRADVLAVLAHPDDEVLAPNLIARWAQEGKQVQVVYVTKGDAGEDVGPGSHSSGAALGEKRVKEAAMALKELGIHRPPLFLDFSDGKTPEQSQGIQTQLRAVLRQTQPAALVMYNPQDGLTAHPDHIAVAKDLETVLNQVATGTDFQSAADRQRLKSLLDNNAVYERILPESSRDEFQDALFAISHWRPTRFQSDAKADVRVPITPSLQQQGMRAMQRHQSQFKSDDLAGMAQYYHTYPVEAYQKFRIQKHAALHREPVPASSLQAASPLMIQPQ